MRLILFDLALLAVPLLALASSPPIADAGPDQSIDTGDTAILNGSATFPDGTPIIGWSSVVVDPPSGAVCRLQTPDQPRASVSCSTASMKEDAVERLTEQERVVRSKELMLAFAERTGVGASGPGRRYLWTDAFAVANFLGLARETGEERYRDLALRLIEKVHDDLGRHRKDEPREGRLGSATEEHPTRGGLRIGKPLPERRADERMDPRLEWDRDGQYFHYLTKWMQALDLTARVTGRPVYNRWARELAATAYEAFSYVGPGGARRMYWKMSIDLSRPLVPSMGQHDPLDGYVSVLQLRETAKELGDAEAPQLADEVGSFEAMIDPRGLPTDDPLGIGGLLVDACRLEQLMRRGLEDRHDLVTRLLEASLLGLRSYVAGGELDEPASRRLAFRELGLAIGLHAVELMADAAKRGVFAGNEAARQRLEALQHQVSLAAAIEQFWLIEEHRQQPTWTEHADINEVMLATSLAPQGFLVLPPVR